ncbi:MAG: histidine kinase [Bacteroidia bacterium]|nr:histidine kinase [Bacteroidia bacterium]
MVLFPTYLHAQESTQKREMVNRLIDENKDDSAILILKQILTQSPKDSIEHQGRVLHQIGKLLIYEGHYRESFQYLEQAQKKYQKIQNRYLENLILQSKAQAYADSGDYLSAINLIQTALTYWEAERDTSKTMGYLLDLGLYYYENNQINLALNSYLKIVNLPYEKEQIQKAKAYNQMGNIWASELGNNQKALEYYFKSLAIKLTLGDKYLKSVCASYNNIGLSYKILRKLDSAAFYYQKSIEFGKKSGAFESLIEPLNNLANIYKRANKLEKSEEALLEAFQYIKYGSISNQILIHTSLGILYNEKKEYDKALSYFKIAKELADKTENLNDMGDVREFMIESYFGLGQLDNANECLAQLLSIKDSITNLKLNQTVAEMMIKYETEETNKALLLARQQNLEKDLKSKQLTMWFLVVLLFLFTLTSYFYLKLRKKQALAKQAALELSLQEQKIKNKIQEERLRISRELHDNIGSHLTLINALTEEFDENDIKSKKIRKSILLSMKELRKTVWLLNKDSNSIDEIVIRLRSFLSNMDDERINILIQASGNTEVVLNDIQTTHFFRTIQEAVNNAIKYSQCSEIKITINIDNNNLIQFKIADNGNGFDTDNTSKNNGLANMKYRIEYLNGYLDIESSPSEGTTIKGFCKV